MKVHLVGIFTSTLFPIDLHTEALFYHLCADTSIGNDVLSTKVLYASSPVADDFITSFVTSYNINLFCCILI